MLRTFRSFASVGLIALAPLTTDREAFGQTMLALGETILLDHSGDREGAQYAAPQVDEIYLHVSISERRLTVFREGEILHRFPVGVGTGAYLRRATDDGGWEFDTPTGVFVIGRKKKDPIWHAPDWYFLERGLPIPPRLSEARVIPGVLGDYALYLGDGIAIHGTRDARSVGRASSHGCLRMTNDAIATIFALVEIGTKVIITP